MTQNVVYFFKYSLNFQGHALKSELNKAWYANFIEFKYDRSNPLSEWAFEKINTQCFYLHFANSNCKVIFSHFILNIKKKLFHIWNLHKIYLLNNFFIYILYCHESGQKWTFSKNFNFLWNQLDAIVFCFFTCTTPQKTFYHQMASSRAKTRSTRSQTCMKYGVIIIFIKKNTDVNTGDLKILHKFFSK